MKKILSLVLAVLLISVLAAVVSANPANSHTINAAYGTPVVDGQKDEIWDTAEKQAQDSFRNGVDNESLANIRFLYDDANLYLLAEVHDVQLWGKDLTLASQTYNTDAAEICLSLDNSTASSYDAARDAWVGVTPYRNFYGSALNWLVGSGAGIDGDDNLDAEFIEIHTSLENDPDNDTTNDYIIECVWHIKAYDESIAMAEGTSFGFELSYNANDEYNNRTKCIGWADATDGASGNPSLFGNVVLGAGGSGAAAPAAAGDFTTEYDGVAMFASTIPMIDGEIDAAWDIAETFESTWPGDLNGEGISGYSKVMWDENALYLLAVVNDDTISPNTDPASCQDSVDLWVSESNSEDLEGFPEAGDYVLTVTPYGPRGELAGTDGLVCATKLTDTGYIVEASVNWRNEGFKGATGKVMAYNISFNNDLDGDNVRDSWTSWQDWNGRPYWSNTISMNVIEMKGDVVAQTSGTPLAPAFGVQEATGSFDGEVADNLFDGDETTKWCFDSTAFTEPYVIWNVENPINVTGYEIVTANDNADYTGRNPGAWTLSGSADGENWTVIADVAEDKVLEDVNFTPFTFAADNAGEYSWFKFEIKNVVGGGVCQISGLNLLTGDVTPSEIPVVEVVEEAPVEEAPAEDEVVEEAPAEEAVEEAPQTFDAAVIAAVAAIVSAAGYAISKKH